MYVYIRHPHTHTHTFTNSAHTPKIHEPELHSFRTDTRKTMHIINASDHDDINDVVDVHFTLGFGEFVCFGGCTFFGDTYEWYECILYNKSLLSS